MIRVKGIEDMKREIFGPVLHIATFDADDLEKVTDAINATGYGLTFGLHTRIDSRVQEITEALHVGNIYVNRNQIGAVVGSQPFGGEGLSGTGPKAGGPDYLPRFTAPEPGQPAGHAEGSADPAKVQAALDATPPAGPIETLDLPGPTGESNRLTLLPRAPLLCLGPGRDAAEAQRKAVEALGGRALWALPLGFVTAMLAGFALSIAGIELPFVEPVILASVVALGLVVAIAAPIPAIWGVALAGFFALFHGNAHGAEIGLAGIIPYAAGFALATAFLHLTGAALGVALTRLAGERAGRMAIRAAGGVTVLGGLALALAA